MMNEKAKSLGALHTNYSNPGGYHSSYMLTTLYDQALISAYASQNKTLLDITSLVSYTMPETNLSKKRTFTNQNLLFDDSHWLRHYTPNTAGLNVGMTSEAGWCISTVFYDDGLTDIVIVSGGTLENYEHKYLVDAKKLMKYAKDQYSFVKVLDKSRVFYDMPVKLDDDKDKILLVTDSEIVSLLPADINADTDIRLESSVDTHELIAPVQAGDVFGTVRAYYGDRLLGVANLVATTSAKRSLKLFVFDKIQKFFANEIVKSIFVFLSSLIFVFLVSIFIYVCIKRRKKRLRQRRYIARGKTHARKDLK
jgi:D-alanyl-D-alanine carboxypeptidase (penicillin-binding protein 5/6)